MVWLFGEENAPPDYIMQVITDSGIGATQRAHIDRQMQAMARQGGTRAGMMKFLRNVGIGASAATTLATYAYNNRASAGREQRQDGLGKRKASPPEETQQAKFHRTEDQEDEANFEGREALLPALPDTNDDDLRELPEDFWEEMGMDVEGDSPVVPTEEEDKANKEFIQQFDKERAMEVDSGPGGEEVSAARAAGGGGPSPVSKETPISPYPSLSYGVQETHTTILPYRAYASFGLLDHDTPLQLRIRTNTINDLMLTELTALAPAGTIGVKKFHTLPVGPGGVNTTGAVFPVELTAGTKTNERPQWRDWWALQYEYFTVLGLKYKFIIHNTANSRGADIEVCVNDDTYSAAVGTTGNITPATKYIEMKAFKNQRWYYVESATSESNTTKNQVVISGTFKPGQGRRNIQNDGDVKTWTKTDEMPNLNEILNLNFYKAGLNYSTSALTCGNVSIELDYIVQFKDLKERLRYPHTLAGTGIISIQSSNTDVDDDVRMRV